MLKELEDSIQSIKNMFKDSEVFTLTELSLRPLLYLKCNKCLKEKRELLLQVLDKQEINIWKEMIQKTLDEKATSSDDTELSIFYITPEAPPVLGDGVTINFLKETIKMIDEA